MRRSSRIQIKREENVADQKNEQPLPDKSIPRLSRLPLRTMKVLSPKRKTSLQPSKPFNSRKQTQINSKSQNGAKSCNLNKASVAFSTPSPPDTAKPKNIEEAPNVEIPQVKTNEKAATSGKTVKNELSVPLLIHEDSDDSILSDVANSLKIDRTIKNLSPKKFFHNKDPKTTRSGRSFSPYDFASYSALFGSICANQTNKTKTESKAGNAVKKVKQESMQHNKNSKHKKARRDKKERSKPAKRPKKQNTKQTRMLIVPPVEFEEPSKIDSTLVGISEGVRAEIPYQKELSAEEHDGDIFSEMVPASFWLDFPFPRFPDVEGQCLPSDFWERDLGGSIPVSDWEIDRKCYETKKPNPDEMTALSKVSLADTDNYEFKSVFKDVSSQIANFEDSCGEWKPSPAYGKFDVMEAESAEGRRFYRKRITDTRLIAWHKYNLASSTRYCPGADVPTTRPVIKVRSNQCHKADLVWRLSQTQPPPSIEDVLNGPVVTHPEPKHYRK